MVIRTGIIGTGFGAAVHAPILQKHPAYHLEAITSMRLGRAKETATRLKIPAFYHNWREMFLNSQLDLVVIATKPASHSEITEVALNSGYHVLCEKPPAMNAAEAESMNEIAERSGHVAAMNFEWRYLPERLRLKELVEQKLIGEILHVNWSESWPLWPEIQDDTASWHWQAEEGGGMLGAIGAHIIDALLNWFGPISEIQGQTINHVKERKFNNEWIATSAEDSFSFIGKFKNGTTYNVSCTVAAVGSPARIEVFGTKGTIKIENHSLSLASTRNGFHEESIDTSPLIDSTSFPKEIQGYVHPQWALYSDLSQVIHGENPSVSQLPTLLQAINVQTALDAIRPSFLKLTNR